MIEYCSKEFNVFQTTNFIITPQLLLIKKLRTAIKLVSNGDFRGFSENKIEFAMDPRMLEENFSLNMLLRSSLIGRVSKEISAD